jgi:hypothetical protein
MDVSADGLGTALFGDSRSQVPSVAELQPDDGANLGRTMRCLFMSFLC